MKPSKAHIIKSSINQNSFSQKKVQSSFFSVGNSAGFFSAAIQPKLTVGPTDDEFEKEADAVADKVMRKPLTGNFFKPSSIPIQRKCAECDEEDKLQRTENEMMEEVIQSKEVDGFAQSYDTSTVEKTLQSSGYPLDAGTKDFMENRFGYDFSHVQVHNDSQAHQSSADINALAYTNQNHVVFGAGQYEPGTDSGKRLLAHELTHVVQQHNHNDVQRFSVTGCKGKPEKTDIIIETLNNTDMAFVAAIQAVEDIIASDETTPLTTGMFGFKFFFKCPDKQQIKIILQTLKDFYTMFKSAAMVCKEQKDTNPVTFDDIVLVVTFYQNFFGLPPAERMGHTLWALFDVLFKTTTVSGSAYWKFETTADEMVGNTFAYADAIDYAVDTTDYLKHSVDVEKLPCLPSAEKKPKKSVSSSCIGDASHTGRYVSVANEGKYANVDGFTTILGQIREILRSGKSEFFCFKDKRVYIKP